MSYSITVTEVFLLNHCVDRPCWDLMPEESGRSSSCESYDPGESVCETTWFAIVLLGLASSEKLQKACNQIKGCWEGEEGFLRNSEEVVEVL